MRGRLKLLLIVALFAAPAIAAWLAHAYWRPARFTNYGELVEPSPLDTAGLRGPDGQTFAAARLKGRWLLLQVAGADCDAACRQSVYLARQARTAQGREMARIERLLVVGTPEARQEAGLLVLAAADIEAFVARLPGGRGGLYLVDPLGRVMMRFPDNPDGMRVIRDLRLLLRASKIG